MKQTTAWALFWFGHGISKILELIDAEWWAAIWYPLYSKAMLTSERLDNDKIWKDATDGRRQK